MKHAPSIVVGLVVVVLGTLPAGAGPFAAVSVETDPAFWVGTLGNGAAIDLNVDARPTALPSLRVGILGYDGRWGGSLARRLLLTDDFVGDWTVRWQGAGVEAQYQLRLGLRRGGLQPGVRLQWNRFSYRHEAARGVADHLAVTPQLGFQWFPSRRGFYLLPWVGVQLPIAGTSTTTLDGMLVETRKVIPVATVHVGWEL